MLAMLGPVEALSLLFVLALCLVPVAAFCKIAQRLGWHWTWGLLTLVPVLNIIILCVFAWGEPPARAGVVVPTPQSPQTLDS